VFKDEIVGVTRDGTSCRMLAECQSLVADGQDIDYDGASGSLESIPAGEPAAIEVDTFDEQGRLIVVITEQFPSSQA
jgi:branched-chain amino acid transport system substrate-binding protein